MLLVMSSSPVAFLDAAAFHINDASIFIVNVNEVYLNLRFLEMKIHQKNSTSAVPGVDVLDWVVISVWKEIFHENLAVIVQSFIFLLNDILLCHRGSC
jgi:hypothetical protein